MWIIIKITTTPDRDGNSHSGWLCTLRGEGWTEWVDAGCQGTGALWDWQNSPEIGEMATEFYTVTEIQVSPAEYSYLRGQVDRAV